MKTYNFTRYRIPVILLSVLTMLAFWGYTIFVAKGFNFGIDFKAGINLIVDVPSAADEQAIREQLAEFNPQVQTVGQDKGRFSIRIAEDENVSDFQQSTSRTVSQKLQEQFGQATVINEEYIGSSFAASLASQTIWMTLIALGLILIYVWIRFKLNYAFSAIVATFHDVFFLLGFIGAFQLEFTTSTIAAVLTILGYSLNDTIVIFDRIRENSRLLKDQTLNDVINISISQTLSRTLITSFTTMLAILAVLFLASGTVQIFALSLVIGIFVGTYSSVYIASPVLLALHNREVKRVKAAGSHHQSSHALAPTKESAALPSFKSSKNLPAPVQQSAQEIAEATERRAKSKFKKKKKKKS